MLSFSITASILIKVSTRFNTLPGWVAKVNSLAGRFNRLNYFQILVTYTHRILYLAVLQVRIRGPHNQNYWISRVY